MRRREFITLIGSVAACGARAAVGYAGDWVVQQRIPRSLRTCDFRVPPRLGEAGKMQRARSDSELMSCGASKLGFQGIVSKRLGSPL